MEGQAAALRRALTAHERTLLKRLVDAELRRREAADIERMVAIKQRYLASKV
jgi:hypothetical protein